MDQGWHRRAALGWQARWVLGRQPAQVLAHSKGLRCTRNAARDGRGTRHQSGRVSSVQGLFQGSSEPLVRAAGRWHGVTAAAAAGGLERALQCRLGRQILGCAAHQLLSRGARAAVWGVPRQRTLEGSSCVRRWLLGCWVGKRTAVCARRHALQAPAAGPLAEMASFAGC